MRHTPPTAKLHGVCGGYGCNDCNGLGVLNGTLRPSTPPRNPVGSPLAGLIRQTQSNPVRLPRGL